MNYLRTLVVLLLPYMGSYGQKSVMKTTKKVATHQYQKVYKWEAYTKKGVVIFGVNKSKEKAQAVIKDFTKRNWNTSARPIAHHITEDVATTNDYFERFTSYFPKGYYVLSTSDISALQIIEKVDIVAAATYLDQCYEKNYEECMEYLTTLHHKYEPYRITN